MCGIFGYVGRKIPDDTEMLNALDTLKHRGPDQSAFYSDYESEYKLWLGHRRLSIQDLSEAGKQPFITPDHKVAVAINGEIYNFRELRHELESRGAEFHSESDSEVLLWGYYYDGEAFFNKIRGMFAAAIWDRKNSRSPRLLLLRDRMGIKPLHYYHKNGVFAFASEIKAFVPSPYFSQSINSFARDQYFVFGYIPAPLTIYENVFKLLPGEYVVFENGMIHKNRYYQIEIPSQKFSGTLNDAIVELDYLLNASVKEEMISDVPLGSFLSGGIDSSIITAIMQRHSSSPVKTFTIGFESSKYDESQTAKAIASFLNTNHTEVIMGKGEMLKALSEMQRLYDEPFADSSALPTYLLSKITRRQVTVALSGDGGDELFFGYNNLPHLQKIAYSEMLPRFLRRATGNFIHNLCKNNKLGLLGKAISYNSFDELYLFASGVFHKLYFDQLRGFRFPLEETEFHRHYLRLSKMISYNYITPYLDMVSYLPDDILCKVDRASMSCSLEVRVPLLDHRVLEFATSLPSSMKYSSEQKGKIILKETLSKYIPKTLWDRPKQGFTPPISDWLKGELKEMTQDYLSVDFLKKEGIFNIDFVQNRLNDHLTGRKNNQDYLWNILQWEIWRSGKYDKTKKKTGLTDA